MKTIRQGVFETNSSSMHAIVISKNQFDFKNKHRKITFDLNEDFSDRCLINRDSANDKASYVFHLLCDIISDSFVNHYKTPYTDDEINLIKSQYKKFESLLELIKEHYKKENIDIDFVNYKLYIDKEIGRAYIISTNGWSILGCYGHDSFVSELGIDSAAEFMNEYILKEDNNINNEKEDSFFWYRFDDLLRFAFDKRSTIIQGSDEMDDKDIKKQKEIVTKYVKKNEGGASVIWPIGG